MVYVVLPPCVGCESVCDDVYNYIYIYVWYARCLHICLLWRIYIMWCTVGTRSFILDENPETKHCWGNDFLTHKKPNMVDPPITMNSWWCGAKVVSLQCWGSQQLQEGIPTLIRHFLWRMEAWMESHVHICHIVWWKKCDKATPMQTPCRSTCFAAMEVFAGSIVVFPCDISR